MVEGEEKLSEKMSALAILACRPNSHPFQERHLTLHEPIKIGRSVARARPAANNCIFDCKVLSRHHAILWYENGSFYLQDTKSSNGTFVNNQRLCKGGEESPPREIFSNDLIQFGVEVMENNRRGEKITHGCIIATITLYHPDGREAKPDPYLNAPSIPGITIQSQDLYQLAHFLQEALHREKMLEQKLSTLQELVHNTQEASESGWQALIDEDKLLSRLEVLENQLHTYSKNHSEDALRQELVALQDEKLSYETTAKESLRRVLQEKLEAVTKLSDLERSLSNAENECAHLKHTCEQAQDELQELAVKYQDQLKEVAELTDRLAQAERAHEEAMSQQEKEKADLNDKIQQMVQQEAMLSAKIEAYQADNDFAKEQISAMKAKYESMKEINENEKIDELGPDINSCSVPEAEIIPLTDKDAGPENLEAKLKETQLQIEHYKAKLEESEAKLRESEEKVEQLQKELAQSKSESEEYLEKISSLEVQLNESQKQCDGSNSLIVQLKARVVELEEELSGTKVGDVTVQTAVPVASSAPHNGVSNHVAPSSSPPPSTSFNDSQDLKDLLEQAKAAQKKAEMELAKSRDDLKETKAKAKKTTEEVLAMRSQLQESQRLAKERSDVIVDLQDQLKKAEGVTKDVKQQILDLREQLEAEKAKHKQTQADLSEAKRHLQESQQNAKQSHNEAEQLKNKLKHLQEELDSERKEKRDSHTPSPSRHSHGGELYSGRMSSARNKEFQALKEECANLRKRIQAIEAEMKMSRRENLQLSSEYNKLQESYKQLEALKVKLDGTEPSGRPGLPPQAPRDSALALQEVSQSTEEVEGLQVQVKSYCQQLEQVRAQLADALSDYRALASRCKTVSMCSSIPLLLLLFAFLLVLYPTLAQLTATS